MRERDFLKPNLSQNPMETQARMCERECEWVCEYERVQQPSRPLFKEKMARAPEERQATTAMEPLEKVGPRSRWPWVGRPVGSAGPRVGPLVPPFGQMLPQWLWTLEIWCTAKSLLKKMFKLFFPKDFKTQKIFLSFCKKGKVLEKFQHAENNFENFKHAVEKNK